MKHRAITMSPELGCWLLWDEDGNNIDPAELGLPHDLVKSLNRLAEWYDSAFDLSDPAREFWSDAQWKAFTRRYRQVAARLRAELECELIVKENRWPRES